MPLFYDFSLSIYLVPLTNDYRSDRASITVFYAVELGNRETEKNRKHLHPRNGARHLLTPRPLLLRIRANKASETRQSPESIDKQFARKMDSRSNKRLKRDRNVRNTHLFGDNKFIIPGRYMCARDISSSVRNGAVNHRRINKIRCRRGRPSPVYVCTPRVYLHSLRSD